MKKLSIFLLGVLTYTSVMAQSITVRFEGANNANNTLREYVVDIDGSRYLSTESEAVRGTRQAVIGNLPLGSHKIAVYQVNSSSTSTSADALLYSNTFQLRSGYDMIIAVRRNGTVTFTEKISTKTGNTSTATSPAMSDADFNKLAASVKAKWSQTSRVTAIKSAFATTTNYFTTDQAGQLLMLITSETSRLELAKLSYPRISDPANFSDIADLFNSQANKENIALFLQSKDSESTSPTTVNTQRFNQLLRQVRNQYNQAAKYALLNDAFNVNTDYYTTAQLRQLLILITAENERLALAKVAYARVSDEANFASLSTMFNTQANRDEFSNYVRYGGSISSSGQYASRAAMSDADFSKLYNKARLHIRQTSVTADVKAAFSNSSNYFSVTQIRSLLTLVATEADRLSIAKLAYHRAADPTSFTQLYDIFTQASIDQLNTYIRNNPS